MSHDAVKQPLLLDGAYRPEAPLTPVSLAVREEAGGIAMAVMALAGGPAVGVGRMVRLWNGADEDLGVFRVTRAMTETGRGGRLRLELEHCLACLCDCVLPYAVSVGTTVSAAVRTLLSSGGAPMTLASAGTDAAISRTGFVGVTVWEAVSTVLASLPEGWRLEVGGDGPPWGLRIAAAESTPCVLSPGWSLISLNCEADLTDYCSRMYPIGKDGLTVRGVNGGDPWVRLTDSPAYGVASRMLSRPDVDSAAQLKTLALQELARLSEPVLSVRAEARELSAVDEEEIIQLRHRSESLYAVYVNVTAIFPLLGILGTVLSLLPMVADLSNMQMNFFAALTSTLWGLIFAILFKLLDGFLSARMEDNDKSVALLLERRVREPEDAKL